MRHFVKHLAIIPARGGSKRIPGKNIRLMNGKPLLAWAIAACESSGLFDHILVSTDSLEIAKVAEKYGAEAPFLRPAKLSGDHIPTAPVVEHALQWACAHWGNPEYFCQLYANPFITADNLHAGHNRLIQSTADVVLGVTEFPYPILRAFRLDKHGGVVYAFPEHKASRSQDLPLFYHDAAQFYWHRHPQQNTPSSFALPVIIPRHLAVDIDTEEDWIIAEKLHNIFFLQGK